MQVGDKVRYIADPERKRQGALEAVNFDGKLGRITRVGKGQATGYVQVYFPDLPALWSTALVDAENLVVIRGKR